jgi:hypothetical protein
MDHPWIIFRLSGGSLSKDPFSYLSNYIFLISSFRVKLSLGIIRLGILVWGTGLMRTLGGLADGQWGYPEGRVHFPGF